MSSQRWKICLCAELKCEEEKHQDSTTGETRKGKAWSAAGFKTHQRGIERERKKKNTQVEQEIGVVGDTLDVEVSEAVCNSFWFQ